MKGKTGKPSAMRGGGLARKGVGMALKGGGIARKGTGSNATPGGKVKKMAMGGVSGGTGGPLPGLFGKPGMGNTPKTPGMVRPGFPSRPASGGPVAIDPRRPSTPKPTGGLEQYAAQNYGADVRGAMNAIGQLPMARKNGGKVAKYAKGGSVKMTAGAGSGSGRLEKVAAHKAAKRIPATGLKKGGKVKGK